MSTLCNTVHPSFPSVTCLVNKGDHRDQLHRAVTPLGVVYWSMMDQADALALIAGRLKMFRPSDAMWEENLVALHALGYSKEQVREAIERYQSL